MNPTLLYVEDEESDRFLVQRAFAKAGLESALVTVNDGRAAMDYMSGTGPYALREKHPLPSVVLLDLNLPEIPGFDVLKWIRAHPRFASLPVVIFSSSAREEDRVQAQSLGANEFVSKPGSMAELVQVARTLGERWLTPGSQAKA